MTAWAAAPDRPKPGPILLEDRLPHAPDGVPT